MKSDNSHLNDVNISELVKQIVNKARRQAFEEALESCMADIQQGNDGSDYANGWYYAMNFIEAKLKEKLEELDK